MRTVTSMPSKNTSRDYQCCRWLAFFIVRLCRTSAVAVAILLLAAAGGRAEVIDRVAVTVDKMVITESDIITHIRVAAFLDDQEPDLSPESRRDAARQLVEQLLIRREMEISRYPAPESADVLTLLSRVLDQRGLDQAGYQAALAARGLRDADVRESLMLQLTLLRFIDYRFRPGIALDDKEVERYYQDVLVPQWDKGSEPPDLDDVRDQIEELLIQQHVDKELDAWLERAARQARIRYREVAFQ